MWSTWLAGWPQVPPWPLGNWQAQLSRSRMVRRLAFHPGVLLRGVCLWVGQRDWGEGWPQMTHARCMSSGELSCLVE